MQSRRVALRATFLWTVREVAVRKIRKIRGAQETERFFLEGGNESNEGLSAVA